jgi:ubiquinone/menaquinone biosynthesis C-methylase UbiE
LGTEVLENHKRYLERINSYKKFGYDVERERTFILEKSKPIEGNILEIGTGKGHFTMELAKKGYSFTSVDISVEEQKFARLNVQYLKLDKQVKFKIDNAEDLSFGNESFDVVFAINLIHHLKKPFKAIDEFARVIKPKGKIVLSDFNEEGFKMMERIHCSEGKKHEAGEVTLFRISNYLKNKGFNIRIHRSEIQDIAIAHN